jgi:hypothetical protein
MPEPPIEPEPEEELAAQGISEEELHQEVPSDKKVIKKSELIPENQ